MIIKKNNINIDIVWYYVTTRILRPPISELAVFIMLEAFDYWACINVRSTLPLQVPQKLLDFTQIMYFVNNNLR